MIARIAADARHNRHQCGEGDDFGNAAFKRADDAAGDECGAEVYCQPRPAVFHRIPHRREQVFLFLQTGHVQDVGFRFFTDNVHHFVHRDTADELVVFIDDGRGNQVVAFERLRRLFRIVGRTETHHVGRHYVGNQIFGVGYQQFTDGQHADEDVVFIHDEDFVGVVGQAFETAQVAQHDLAAHVGTNADQFEIHQCADQAVFVRHRRLHLLAFFLVAGLQGFINHLVRQIVGQLGQIVGIQIFHRRQQFVFAHAFDQGFTHSFRHFQQYVAVVFRLGQFPHDDTLFRRQRFEQDGHVRRVQFVQDGGQLGQFGVQFFVGRRAPGGNIGVNGQQCVGQFVNVVDIQIEALAVCGLGRGRDVRCGHKCSARRKAAAHSGGFRIRWRSGNFRETNREVP